MEVEVPEISKSNACESPVLSGEDYKSARFNDHVSSVVEITQQSFVYWEDGSVSFSCHIKSKGRQNLGTGLLPFKVQVIVKSSKGDTFFVWNAGEIRWDCRTNETRSFTGVIPSRYRAVTSSFALGETTYQTLQRGCK